MMYVGTEVGRSDGNVLKHAIVVDLQLGRDGTPGIGRVTATGVRDPCHFAMNLKQAIYFLLHPSD